MSVTSLRPITRLDARPLAGNVQLHRLQPAPSDSEVFGVAMLRSGRISASTLLEALRKPQVHLIDRLIASGAMPASAAYSALAAHWAVGLADFTRHAVDKTLIDRVDAATCLAGHWVPWRKMGASTVIVCAYPEDFTALRPKLTQVFGTVALALAPRSAIESQIFARAGATLARRAETLLPNADSCRSFSPRQLYAPLLTLVTLTCAGILAAPMMATLVFLSFALILAYTQTALKLAALFASLRRSPVLTPRANAGLHLVPADADLPKISIMVPLFCESRIVARLIRRLERLDYPATALEIIFLTEDNDIATATALASITLPPWMRVVSVPTGTIRTKPRALNYGLDHCTGSIIGVYDAEDAPDLGQLRAVAQGFASGGPRLACLQGRLDYYNPHHNWLSRCFTIEYAAWWRVILPGFVRMGFAIPLGGTTLFLRSDVLRALGGWDAHNVTEDADLGLRLVRRGYRTQLLDSTTYEEANCRAVPWVKQRSRWIKGYIMTYASHMRSPRSLLRDLGAWQFFGMQIMFAGSVIHALAAPILFLLWLVALGAVSLTEFSSLDSLLQFAAFGFAAEAALLFANYLGLWRAGHKIGIFWLLSMMAYSLLASLAAYKAVYEVMTKPFYWDKTAHGLFDD